jgi:hypothetical protein
MISLFFSILFMNPSFGHQSFELDPLFFPPQGINSENHSSITVTSEISLFNYEKEHEIFSPHLDEYSHFRILPNPSHFTLLLNSTTETPTIKSSDRISHDLQERVDTIEWDSLAPPLWKSSKQANYVDKYLRLLAIEYHNNPVFRWNCDQFNSLLNEHKPIYYELYYQIMQDVFWKQVSPTYKKSAWKRHLKQILRGLKKNDHDLMLQSPFIQSFWQYCQALAEKTKSQELSSLLKDPVLLQRGFFKAISNLNVHNLNFFHSLGAPDIKQKLDGYPPIHMAINSLYLMVAQTKDPQYTAFMIESFSQVCTALVKFGIKVQQEDSLNKKHPCTYADMLFTGDTRTKVLEKLKSLYLIN